MRIVELGDCSMVIMKDSEDPPWESIGNIYRYAKKFDETIIVDKDHLTLGCLSASDYVYSGGRLVLFFKDSIPPKFQLHDKVVLSTRWKFL